MGNCEEVGHLVCSVACQLHCSSPYTSKRLLACLLNAELCLEKDENGRICLLPGSNLSHALPDVSAPIPAGIRNGSVINQEHLSHDQAMSNRPAECDHQAATDELVFKPLSDFFKSSTHSVDGRSMVSRMNRGSNSRGIEQRAGDGSELAGGAGIDNPAAVILDDLAGSQRQMLDAASRDDVEHDSVTTVTTDDVACSLEQMMGNGGDRRQQGHQKEGRLQQAGARKVASDMQGESGMETHPATLCCETHPPWNFPVCVNIRV